jgi:hypothetical protein
MTMAAIQLSIVLKGQVSNTLPPPKPTRKNDEF